MRIIVTIGVGVCLALVSPAGAGEDAAKSTQGIANIASAAVNEPSPTVKPAALFPRPIEEAPSAKDAFENRLTGDWGGFRRKLAEKGVQLEVTYDAEVLSNVSGGRKRGVIYDGLMYATADFDFDKMFHWQGGSGRLGGAISHGTGHDDRNDICGLTDALFFDSSNITARDMYRFCEIWLQQELLDGRLSFRAGSLAADDEFLVSDYQSAFIDSTSGWPAFLFMTLPNWGPSFPVAGLGARVAYKINDQLEAKAAVFEGDVGNQINDNHNGIDFHLNSREGVFSIYELTYRLNQAKGASGLPDTFKLGGWNHTGDEAPSHGGIYLDAEQMVYRENPDSMQGLGVFCRLAPWIESKDSPMDFYASAGLHYLGLIPGRDRDITAVAAHYAHETDGFEREKSLSYELAMELTYKIAMAPWWSLQPDVQYICRPGASTALEDAIVVGLRTSLNF